MKRRRACHSVVPIVDMKSDRDFYSFLALLSSLFFSVVFISVFLCALCGCFILFSCCFVFFVVIIFSCLGLMQLADSFVFLRFYLFIFSQKLTIFPHLKNCTAKGRSMKILSKYILREHAGPFILSVMVITFIMLLDRVLDLLNLIITKHLDIWTTTQVFVLSLPFMLALAIPMAVLVATIMAFGRLSSDNEITAFKANGINIYSMMKPVVIVAVLISIFMIYFNDHILPESNYALKNLLIKISARRPTSELKPGLFTELKDYNFYFHDKSEDGKRYNEIVIYDKNNGKYPKTITSEYGNIELFNGGNSLNATLYNGLIHEISKDDPQDYTTIVFKKYMIKIPDLGIGVSEAHLAQRGDREMSSSDMKKHIEELDVQRQEKIKEKQKYENQLTLINENPEEGDNKEISKLKHLIGVRDQRIYSLSREISKYQVEVDKKYSIAFACLVFILIGAPIGMMTRTNSVGMGFTVSSLVFVVYYVSLFAGEELADKMIISPFIGMWISNIIFTIAGIYLVIYSMRERKIIHLERIKNIFKRKQKIEASYENN